MIKRKLAVALSLAVTLMSGAAFAQQKSVLFDAGHAQTSGNADWTLDEDSCGIAQRYPTPDQAGITSSTAETYWSGGHSAFGVDLVKKGFHVESLPTGARISYNDTTNAQDLKNYNVFVIPEPNVRFTTAEVTAIRAFVQNGGGLFMISDHAGADRNSDGWEPPAIFNDLMGSPSLFGITYNTTSTDKTYGWFDNNPDDNYTNDTTSPIVWAGPYGAAHAGKGLGLFGSTSMTITGAAKAHIWKTGLAKTSTIGVTFATSTYGTGRIAAAGDSSISEDATNGCGHTTYLGYNDPAWDNGLIIANAVAWLANGSGGTSGDTTAPTVSISSPAAGATVTGTVSVNATASDNVGVTKVEFYLDGVLQSTDTVSAYSWSWATTGAANGSHSLTAKAYDAAGNVKTSTAVSVTVSNTGGGTDTTAPTASITSPTSGSTVSGTVTVNASATDNVGVTKLEIYIDGTLRNSTTTASTLSYSWNTTTFANSSHTIVAKGYDAAGNIGSSSNVTVTVSNGGTTTTQLLSNAGFESGVATPWVASTGIIDNSASEAAHGGSWKAWLDGYGSAHTDSLYQTAAIPSSTTSATLTFWLHVDTAETGTTVYDTLKVQVRNTSGTVLATLATYSNVNAAAGYQQKSFNLSSYAGQSVQIYLVGTEDSTAQTSFVVDDFALNVQ